MNHSGLEQADYIALFQDMHPDFFKREDICGKPEENICEEMILALEDFDPAVYRKEFAPSISFGIYEGSLAELKKAVEKVLPGWLPFFHEGDRFYCGYINGQVASFCIIEDMGKHQLGGRTVKIGGPGCVGTVPEYRNRGVGLTMVSHVTEILKAEGYDYSYIHYTGVAPWYAKLGYRTCVRWTGKGILE